MTKEGQEQPSVRQLTLFKAEKAALQRVGIQIRKVVAGDPAEIEKIHQVLHQIAVDPDVMHAKISAEDEQYLEDVRDRYEREFEKSNTQ